jgi:WD40 repeat protein
MSLCNLSVLSAINHVQFSARKTRTSRDIKSLKYLGSLEGHKAEVCWLFTANGKLFSASTDGQIQVRDAETNACLATLEGLATKLCSPLVADQKLFFPSNDGTIHIWNVESLKHLETLKVDSGEVACLLVDNEKLFAASNKGEVYIWDLQSLALVAVLASKDFNQRIFSLAANKTTLFVGESQKIGIWNLKTYQIEYILRGHEEDKEVSSLSIVDGKLYYLFHSIPAGYLNNIAHYKVMTLDLESNQYIFLQNQAERLSSLCIEKGNLFIPFAGIIHVQDPSYLYSIRTYNAGARSFATVDGCVFAACATNIIKLDFTAGYPAILKEIADYLESKENNRIYDTRSKLLRMPASIKNQVYSNELYFNPLEIAQEIRKYLNPSQIEFLNCFGIVTREQYFKQLSCTPEYLETIGITSDADLSVLCPFSSHIQPLKIEPQAMGLKEEKSTEPEVQRRANQRKTDLFALCGQILQAVSVKIREANICLTVIDTSQSIAVDGNPPNNPWISFQEDLNGFVTRLNAIVAQCDALPRNIVEAFTPEGYNKLAKELNILIEEFHKLDREFQMIKLRTYVNQKEVFEAWLDLHAEGIRSLTDLSKKNNDDDNSFFIYLLNK